MRMPRPDAPDDEASIILDIRDQGKGMSAERLAEIQLGRSGVGIGGMRNACVNSKGL
jgi:signal transduction histidine kinase